MSTTREQAAPAALDRPAECSARGVVGFELRVVLGFVAVVLGALPFLALLLLLRREWPPLQGLDDRVADDLNDVVSRSPALVDALRVVTDLGGNGTAVYVCALATAWFWIRRQPRLAWYVATTGAGLAVLVPVTKALVGRPRPQVALPVVDIPSNASFPSGHAMVSLVTWGVVALVLMPAVRPRLRGWLVATAVLMTAAVGFTRLALGVHFVSDVIAGWALGAGWLAVTTAAFRGWQSGPGRPRPALSEGLDPQSAEALRLVEGDDPLLPGGHWTAQRLALAALAVVVGLSAAGLLVTGPLLGTPLGRFDSSVVATFVELRTPARTEVARAVGELSGTRAVIAIALAEAVLIVAVTAAWRPALFVVVVVCGEVLLYFLTAELVGRSRPDVPDLTSGLPVGASWPSGHSAAAVAVYGALAVLVIVHSRSRWRYWTLVLPVLVPPLIGLSRVYVAAHRPSDVLAGLTLGTVWLLLCTRYLLPYAAVSRRGSATATAASGASP